MKLLIYSHFFAPSVGGVETIVESLARGLVEKCREDGGREFEVTLATRTPAVNFDDGALPFRVVRRPGLLALWQLIRAADVIHVAGPALAPLVLGRLARKPIVIEHHGYQAICPNGLLFLQPSKEVCPGHFVARRYGECLRCNASGMSYLRSLRLLWFTFLRRALSESASMNIAVSQHVRARVGFSRCVVIYHGVVDHGQSDSDAPQETLAHRPSFAYVGRFVEEKGIPVLLEAARRLSEEGREVQVRLIGDGPARPGLERIIRTEGLESAVRITGLLSGEALNRELRTVDCIIMPSVSEETAGLAAMDQMMRGHGVIAAAIGGLGEIVGEAGLTFPSGDAQALAACMGRVLDEAGLFEALGERARQRAREVFSRAGMIEAHARVYRELRGAASQ